MTIKCEGDADTEIVQAAFTWELSREDNVTVLADDADITVLLIHGIQEVEQSTGSSTKIYQDRMGKVYDISYVTNNIPSDLRRAVLFIHSFMGCDTTSSIFGHGHKALTKDRIPTSVACDTFYNSSSQIADITEVGEKLMLSIFNSKCNDLDNQYYITYCRKVGSGAVGKKKGIDHHSLRAYHQVQSWLGQTKDPLQYGWKTDDDVLYPVTMDKPAAPDSILSPIKCSRKTDCQSARCSCRKNGVLCSNFCACDQCSNCDREAGPGTVEMQPTDNEETDELQYDFGSCSDSDISDSAD